LGLIYEVQLFSDTLEGTLEEIIVISLTIISNKIWSMPKWVKIAQFR